MQSHIERAKGCALLITGLLIACSSGGAPSSTPMAAGGSAGASANGAGSTSELDAGAASGDSGAGGASSGAGGLRANGDAGGGVFDGGAGGATAGGQAGASGASGTSGGSAALEPGKCRSVVDCQSAGGDRVLCLAPHEQTPPTLSPIPPGWCGAPSHLCPPAATECEADPDCSTERPKCLHVLRDPNFNTEGSHLCSECAEDKDCPSELPRCVENSEYRRECQACAGAADCADGVCDPSTHTCVPGCTTRDECTNPALPCSERHRCEAEACSANGSCSAPNMTCATGVCVRTACKADADCSDEGFCVNGRCHEALGRCYIDRQPP